MAPEPDERYVGPCVGPGRYDRYEHRCVPAGYSSLTGSEPVSPVPPLIKEDLFIVYSSVFGSVEVGSTDCACRALL